MKLRCEPVRLDLLERLARRLDWAGSRSAVNSVVSSSRPAYPSVASIALLASRNRPSKSWDEHAVERPLEQGLVALLRDQRLSARFRSVMFRTKTTASPSRRGRGGLVVLRPAGHREGVLQGPVSPPPAARAASARRGAGCRCRAGGRLHSGFPGTARRDVQVLGLPGLVVENRPVRGGAEVEVGVRLEDRLPARRWCCGAGPPPPCAG